MNVLPIANVRHDRHLAPVASLGRSRPDLHPVAPSAPRTSTQIGAERDAALAEREALEARRSDVLLNGRADDVANLDHRVAITKIRRDQLEVQHVAAVVSEAVRQLGGADPRSAAPSVERRHPQLVELQPGAPRCACPRRARADQACARACGRSPGRHATPGCGAGRWRGLGSQGEGQEGVRGYAAGRGSPRRLGRQGWHHLYAEGREQRLRGGQRAEGRTGRAGHDLGNGTPVPRRGAEPWTADGEGGWWVIAQAASLTSARDICRETCEPSRS